MRKSLAFFTFLAVSISSCITHKTEPEHFETFLQNFHADTAFQISRIVFPLQGGRFYEENIHITEWSQKNWECLKASPNEIDTTIFKVVSDSTTTSHSYIIGTLGIKITERYELIDNKWHLVYYEDISN